MKFSVHLPSLKSASLVAMATLLSGLSAYVLSVVSARILSAAEFGAFNTILSLCLVGNTLALAIQVHAAREIQGSINDIISRQAALEKLQRLVFQISCVTAVLVVVSSPILAKIFRIEFWTLILGLLSLVPVIVGFATIGVSQGTENHKELAANITLNVGGRAVSGILGLMIFGNLYSGSLGIFLGSFIGALASSRLINFCPKFGGWNFDDWNIFWKSWVALGALFFLINSDVLVARYVFSAEESGAYSAGAVLSRVAFFIPGAILVVLFPRFNSGTKRNYLKITFAVSLGIGLAVSASAYLFRDSIISILGGEKYVSIKDLLWLFCIQGSIFALIQIAIYQMTNLRDRNGVYLVLFAGFGTLGFGNLFGGSLSGLIELSVVISFVTCVLSAARIGVYEVRSSKRV